MRLTVVTFGSEGDTRPLAALCHGLLARGHDLKLFAEQSTLTLPLKYGVPCEALTGDVRATLPIGDPHEKLGLRDVLKTGRDLKALAAANSASWIRTVAAHARDSDAILFSSLAVGAGIVLAESLGKPKIGLWFQPVTPTRTFCSPMMPPMKLPGWMNLATYRLLHRQMWGFSGEASRAAQLEVFGTKHTGRPRFDFPVLYCISRELVSQPDDWPSTHHICGHWSLPMSDWEPPAALREFLADGEAPIHVGFGSPSAFIRAKALTAVIDAVAGRRAIFSPGWSRIDERVLPKNFFIARDVPHEWLFPRVSVAIHHGGAGTTHTAARAGIPQVVLPLGADHHFWASRAAARGAAPKYRKNARLDSKALSGLIDFALREDTKANARALGEAMSRERGVDTAAAAIERYAVA